MMKKYLLIATSLILACGAFAHAEGVPSQELKFEVRGQMINGFASAVPNVKMDVSCVTDGALQPVTASGTTDMYGNFSAGQMPLNSQCNLTARSADGKTGLERSWKLDSIYFSINTSDFK